MTDRKDYYKLLEINKSATADEIKKAYYKLAKQYHPDKNPNNPQSAEKFKAVKEAYETLSDANKKADYDSNAKKPQTFTPTPQNYQTSSFPNFNMGGGKSKQKATFSRGAKIFTFDVHGNTAGIPLSDILRMFFGGMSDFGEPTFTPRPTKKPFNPNAAAVCQFCKQLFTVPDLINHQANCPSKPSTSEDFRNRFPSYADEPNMKQRNWRQQHNETLNSIRRDKERASESANRYWDDTDFEYGEGNFEYEFHQSGLVQCPTCLRKFNMEAASHHVPFCRQKAQEEEFQKTSYQKPEEKPSVNSFQRAREYANNLKKNKGFGKNNHNFEWYNIYWDESCNDSSHYDLSDRSSSENSQFSFSDFYDSGFNFHSTPRKTTLPDIWLNNQKFDKKSNKSRRKTTPNIFETEIPPLFNNLKFTKLSRGCDDCIRVYGFEAAKIHCSCGFKTSTNLKHK